MSYCIAGIVLLLTALYLNNNAFSNKSLILSHSWIKTLALFLLTIIVGTFYYKTNQVITVPYQFWIDGYNVAFSKGSVVDSIEVIEIRNNFESSFFNDAYRKTRNNSVSFNYTINPPKSSDWNLFAYKGINQLDTIGHLFKLEKETMGKSFRFELYLPEKPSFVPIKVYRENIKSPEYHNHYIRIQGFKENLYDSLGLYYPFEAAHNIISKIVSNNVALSNSDRDKIYNDFLKEYKNKYTPNGLQKIYSAYNSYIVTEKNHLNLTVSDSGTIENCLFDFFTAADLSQYILNIGFLSDLPISKISFRYDIPIEISSDYEDLVTGTYGFELDDKRIGDIEKNGGSHSFYIKLPSMANLQLVRSFILTSILVSLITIFFISLIKLLLAYRLRIIVYINNKLDNTSAKATTPTVEKVFKYFRLVVLLFISFIICYLCYLIWIDEPIVINEISYTKYKNLALISFLIISFVYIFLYLKCLYTKGRLNEKSTKGKSSFFKIIFKQLFKMPQDSNLE